MKGTVVVCLHQLVEAKFGERTWMRILEAAGLDRETILMPLGDYDDEMVFALVGATCRVTGLTQQQAFDAYAEYWVTEYSKRNYTRYHQGCTSAREFLQKLGHIHRSVTATIPNARPPEFRLEWLSDACLHLHYRSQRGLIDLVTSMAKAVGKLFGERLGVRKVSETVVEVTFP
jgi:Haem-NO-binding